MKPAAHAKLKAANPTRWWLLNFTQNIIFLSLCVFLSGSFAKADEDLRPTPTRSPTPTETLLKTAKEHARDCSFYLGIQISTLYKKAQQSIQPLQDKASSGILAKWIPALLKKAPPPAAKVLPLPLYIELDAQEFVSRYRNILLPLLNEKATALYPITDSPVLDTKARLSLSRRKLLSEMSERVALAKSIHSGYEFFSLYLGPLERGRIPHKDLREKDFYLLIPWATPKNPELICLTNFSGLSSIAEIATDENEVAGPSAQYFKYYIKEESFLFSNDILLRVRTELMKAKDFFDSTRDQKISLTFVPLNESHRDLLIQLALISAKDEFPSYTNTESTSNPEDTRIQLERKRYDFMTQNTTAADFQSALSKPLSSDMIFFYAQDSQMKVTHFTTESLRMIGNKNVQEFFKSMKELTFRMQKNSAKRGATSNTQSVQQELENLISANEALDRSYLMALQQHMELGQNILQELRTAESIFNASISPEILTTKRLRDSFEHKKNSLARSVLDITLGIQNLQNHLAVILSTMGELSASLSTSSLGMGFSNLSAFLKDMSHLQSANDEAIQP